MSFTHEPYEAESAPVALAGHTVVDAQLERVGKVTDVLFDDRAASPGSRFADAELIGMPARVTVGKRTATEGTADVQVRRGREQRSLPVAEVAAAVRAAVDAA